VKDMPYTDIFKTFTQDNVKYATLVVLVVMDLHKTNVYHAILALKIILEFLAI